MKHFPFQQFLLVLFSILYSGCSPSWEKIIKNGEIVQKQFQNKVPYEKEINLIFIPVQLKGKTYRFLFDSGAPLSISKEIQKREQFKIISTGNIKDSNHHIKKVKWCAINSIQIGGVNFKNQSAFVGDFTTNPLLKCLQIDGIIGANLQRQCNWTIDPQKQTIALSPLSPHFNKANETKINFRSDQQYNMYINIKLENLTVKNVLVDLGSSGNFAVSKSIFNTINRYKKFDKIYNEIGIQQTGIIGKSKPLERKIALLNTLEFNDHNSQATPLKTGNTTSLGNAFFSRYQTEINWKEKCLYLTPINKQSDIKSYGFSLGLHKNKDVFVQSIVKESPAYKIGIRPNMKVKKLNQLNFHSNSNFCDYIKLAPQDNNYIEIIDNNGETKSYYFKKNEY